MLHDGYDPITTKLKLTLDNGKLLFCNYVVFVAGRSSGLRKVFIKESDRERDRDKDLCLTVNADKNDPLFRTVLAEEINAFLQDILCQAKVEFVGWLDKYGSQAGDPTATYGLSELQSEWHYKKLSFGLFRRAENLHFFSDYRPEYANLFKIVQIDIVEDVECQ